jgi:hypothetical protein
MTGAYEIQPELASIGYDAYKGEGKHEQTVPSPPSRFTLSVSGQDGVCINAMCQVYDPWEVNPAANEFVASLLRSAEVDRGKILGGMVSLVDDVRDGRVVATRPVSWVASGRRLINTAFCSAHSCFYKAKARMRAVAVNRHSIRYNVNMAGENLLESIGTLVRIAPGYGIGWNGQLSTWARGEIRDLFEGTQWAISGQSIVSTFPVAADVHLSRRAGRLAIGFSHGDGEEGFEYVEQSAEGHYTLVQFKGSNIRLNVALMSAQKEEISRILDVRLDEINLKRVAHDDYAGAITAKSRLRLISSN